MRWFTHQVAKRVAGERPVTVNICGQHLTAPRSHPEICLVLYVRGGLYDLEAFLTYSAFLKPGYHFLDVGANIGAHSLVAGRLVGPSGFVVTVEPEPEAREWLERNLVVNGVPAVVEARPIADRRRELLLAGVGDTTRYLTGPAGGPPIVTTTVDELAACYGLQPAKLFVKVDVEGWEPAVILGARATLEAGCLGLWVEASGLQDRCDTQWDRAVALLLSLGYRFWIPDVECGCLRRIPDPAPVSPIGDYLVTLPERAGQVGAALERWGALVSSCDRG